MNDLSELQYASELVEKRLGLRGEEPHLSEIQREFISRISGSFNQCQFSGSVFSVSFCEDGNLLSQWRAYRGHGGGYAIGFDFFHTMRLLSRPCVLRRVIYEEEQQVRLIDQAIDGFLTTLHSETTCRSSQDVTDNFLPNLSRTFSEVISEYLFSFKHPNFKEEREWRLVHFASTNPTTNRNADLPQFRSYEGNVIPFFALSLEDALRASRDDTLGFPLPIAELMIGPTVNADLNQESIKLLLLAINPDIEPNIRRSEIPLRWL
jgi:hypothetical protein